MGAHGSNGVSRREFLKAASATAIAAGAASTATAQQPQRDSLPPPSSNPRVGEPVSQTVVAQEEGPKVPGPPTKKLGFAVLGLGKFAMGQILPSFGEAKHARLAAVVSGDRTKAQAVAAHHRLDPTTGVYTYDDFDRIADNPDVDVVYIITPPALHRPWVERAAKAGKHVLCEKPMAPSAEDCEAMIQACASAERKLMVAYRVHYEPYNQQAMQWSREMKFGPIRHVVTEQTQDVGGRQQWRLDKQLAGGGCLFDLGIYGLQAQLYLTNEEPTHVSAMITTPADDDRFDSVEGQITWQLRFPSGALATGSCSYCATQINRVRAIATNGWYAIDPATSYHGQRLFYGESDGQQQLQHELKLQPANQFVGEMDHFAQCVQNGDDPRTPGEMGLRDIRLMLKIYEAAETGRMIPL